MTDPHHGNAAFRWAITFLNSLRDNGVRHVVLSPGSRSTPLTLAAASDDYFNKYVILDERSAAFTALGIGKATNMPAVLICTSGTAAANYFPAVIEARKSGVPMILATADRPPHLRATGANQAIDQLKIYGDYPVFFHEVGEPASDDEDINRLQLLGQQAVTISREKRGPVHLNFPFRKPLEPEKAALDKSEQSKKSIPKTEPKQSSFSVELSHSIQDNISSAERPLILIGPLAPDDDTYSIAELSNRLNAPILTESAIDHANNVSGFSGFLRNDGLRAELEPDLILRFGFQPTSKSLKWSLENWTPDHHYHFASTDEWQDATFSGAERIAWMGKEMHFNKIDSSSSPQWIEKWRTAESEFNRHVEKSFEEESELTDGMVYRYLTPQIPENHFLTVSNSFAARDIHLFGKHSPDIPLFQNRGVSGIDGVTSTAIGLSLGLGKPGILFTGDLAFLHDTNALLNHQKPEHSLTVIVLNNAGGNIFRMLPIEQFEQYFDKYFETPQSVNIQKLTGSHDIPYLGINSIEGLYDIDLRQWTKRHAGLSVIECQTEPDASMRLREKLWEF